MTEERNRCVITGLGMICAIGNNVEEAWGNAVKGVSGIKETTTVDTKDCYSRWAAEVDDPTLDNCENAEKMDRVSRLCIKAAGEALADASFSPAKDDSRVSVIMGSCVGGVASIEDYYRNGKTADKVLKMPISAIANEVAYTYGADGIVTNIANACAAGTISIAYACDLIRAGKTDVVIAGGADAFASVPYAGFLSLHALSEEPCSPFNHCNGITLGEGAGVVIVESYEHAAKRNAKIYCEVLGSGISSDAHHITAPRPDGEGQMFAISRSLAHSGVTADHVDYINAHGTGTAKNDEAEFLSLHTVFDETNDHLSVSSTKAMVGHCLGAAGAIEAVFSIKALTENKIPPTVGYSDADMEILKEKAGKIDFMPNNAKDKELSFVMSNSFAFGGNNASILFGREAGDVTLPDKKEKVYLTGLGIVSPCGNGTDNYIAAYSQGSRPAEGSVQSAVGNEDFAACGLKMAFYRKLDKFSQLQAVSGMSAILDAKLTVTDENAQSIGVIVGTSDGPLSTICNFQKDLVEGGNVAGSAFKFPNTVYNAAGGYLSICSGIKGYTATVTNGIQSGISSIAYGCQMIRQGNADIILATGTDETSDVITELYEKLGASSEKADGFILGDGSTTLVLESGSSIKKRGITPYAEVAGFGTAHKSVPFGEIEGSDEALDAAILDACEDAGISISEIDAVVGFANGLPAVDEAERASYKHVFGDADIPVYSVKGIVGESRAAGAALSAAHAALLLAGKITSDKELKTVLVTSCAAGGSYCAVILKK